MFIDGQRIPLFLGGKYSKTRATKLKEVIETLIACRDNRQQPEKWVVNYLEEEVPEIKEKLESAGLIEQPKIRTLVQLWDAFELEQDVKATTKRIYGQASRNFFAFFKDSDPLEKVTKDSLLKWKKHLAKKSTRSEGRV